MKALVVLMLLSASLPAAAAGLGASPGVTVPIDVGVGPAVWWITGPVADDQTFHYGLKINVAAVIDQEWIRNNPRAIPRQYKAMARNVNELRLSYLLIPDSLFISPKLGNTGIYGATWRPIGLNQTLGEGAAKLRLGAGLMLTYAFLYSDVLPTTHFLRPGIDLTGEFEVMAAKKVGVSLGWSSTFYIPQQLGSFGVGSLDESMWHFGQGFVKLHFRFPYEVQR